ncbi:hypothetical protein AVEN_238778-1 [Araneus ventricosus]|uniref:Uncharacterized protein n=1 Tax=Araneus ventricosus TaxID=182803 RepID=A0A4Y2IZ99_ARAVE|nr:hypothetical protein AVEN_238778-1 [Araneus ventricosus]
MIKTCFSQTGPQSRAFAFSNSGQRGFPGPPKGQRRHQGPPVNAVPAKDECSKYFFFVNHYTAVKSYNE